GIAGLAAERVTAAMQLAPDTSDPAGVLDALAKLFQLHPAFHPRAYVDFHVERAGNEVRCWIGDCEAFAEDDSFSWFALLGAEPHRAVSAMARVIDPRARCRPCVVPGARAAWSVTLDASAEPASEPPEVTLT